MRRSSLWLLMLGGLVTCGTGACSDGDAPFNGGDFLPGSLLPVSGNGGGGKSAGENTTQGGAEATSDGGKTQKMKGEGGEMLSGGDTGVTGEAGNGLGGKGGASMGLGGAGEGGATEGGAPMGDAGMGGDQGGGPLVPVPLQTLRDTPDGDGLSLLVKGVIVTYMKPALGAEPAGFFIQERDENPGLFVVMDPGTIKVGDRIDFTATRLATYNGVREITALDNLTVSSSSHALEPLITDISDATDLIANLFAYESRAIRVTGTLGDFVNAGAPYLAAPLETLGLSDPRLKLRLPPSVIAAFDLEADCQVTVDHGVMWRFNEAPEPSVYDAADLSNVSCPAPELVGASATSKSEVVFTFNRRVNPASIAPADFAFDHGLVALATQVDDGGKQVTVTTSLMAAGTEYTVTVGGVKDVLGADLAQPSQRKLHSFETLAGLLINELSPNISGQHDLIELLVTSAGSTGGISVVQSGAIEQTLVTLPSLNVSAGDLLVVHLTPVGTVGIAPASENVAKDEYSSGSFSANYDGAWDILGEAIGLTYSSRIIEVSAPGDIVLDAVPVVQSTSMPPGAFPASLQALQQAGRWFPADCGGSPCSTTSTPTLYEVSVDYFGTGLTPSGASVQRKPGKNTRQSSDFTLSASSFGQPN